MERVALFEKIQPRRVSDEIAARIRRSLTEGSLKPGEKLPSDAELARLFGVSRGSLRDALRGLDAAGVLQIRKGRNGGTFVSGESPKVLSTAIIDELRREGVTVVQLTEARIWIEDLVVRVACQRATDADLAALDANVARARAQFDEGRYLAKAITHIEFHDILARATKNPLLVIIMHVLTEAMTAFVQAHGADNNRATFASRTRFLTAMRARDVEAAVEEMRANLRRTNAVYLRLARAASGRRKADAPALHAEPRDV